MTSSPPPDAAAPAASTASSASSVPLGVDLGHSVSSPPSTAYHLPYHPPPLTHSVPCLPPSSQYACIGVWRNGSVDIIANDLGSRSTPVLLSFTDKEVLFGEAAQSQLAVNLKATVHHTKRLLGLPFSHPTVQLLKSHVDYSIVPSSSDDPSSPPSVQLSYKGEDTRYRPEALLGMMLTRLKGIADRYSGSDCKECVLAVPSSFSPTQRQALVSAGQQAGLTVLTVLNEATAAAIAFNLDLAQASKGGKTKENIAVVDVGGATTTVTILQSEAGLLTQKAVTSDLHLGGDDFDAVLVEHFSREFLKQTQHRLASSHRALARLSVAVEKAKRVLSSSTSASIELDGLLEGEDFYSKVSRAKFESLAAPLFRRLTALIQSALQRANVSPVMVDHVCLIGGSSRIPRVQDIVKQVMGGKEAKKGINPEEAVAVGCTIQASLLVGRGQAWEAVVHSEEGVKRGEIALGHSIGVEGDDGVVRQVLSKGTTAPTHVTFTVAPHRSSTAPALAPYTLRVYEGERALARDCHLLATLVIPASVTGPITASLTVDKQRKLHIRAYTGKTVHAELTVEPTTAPRVEPTRSIDAVGEGNGVDAVLLERAASRQALYDLLLTLKEPKAVVDAAWLWLQGKKISDGEAEEKEDAYETKKAEVEEAVEEWKEGEAKRKAAGSAADLDDVDDFVAHQSLNGHAAGNGSGGKAGGGDDFEHEIADLD